MNWWPYLSLFAIFFQAATLFSARSQLALAPFIVASHSASLVFILAAATGSRVI